MGARLVDGAALAGDVHQFAPFANGEADRFLAVNVLARLGREHGSGGMPAVAGGNEHRVDILSREQIAEIREIDAILIAVVLIDLRLGDPPAIGPGIADGREVDLGEGEEVGEDMHGAVAHADAAKDDPVARGHRAVQAEDRAGNNQRGRDRSQRGKKTPAVQAGSARCHS